MFWYPDSGWFFFSEHVSWEGYGLKLSCCVRVGPDPQAEPKVDTGQGPQAQSIIQKSSKWSGLPNSALWIAIGLEGPSMMNRDIIDSVTCTASADDHLCQVKVDFIQLLLLKGQAYGMQN